MLHLNGGALYSASYHAAVVMHIAQRIGTPVVKLHVRAMKSETALREVQAAQGRELQPQ